MFLLMPFVAPGGGWVEKYNGKEFHFCEGNAMPFTNDNPITNEVWYSGNFSQVNQNFSENEKVLWRVKTDRFVDDAQWEWFLNLELQTPNPIKLHGCHYIEDGQDIYPTAVRGHIVGDQFKYPLWVLDLLIERGHITDKNMIQMIEMRRKEEKELGFENHSLQEMRLKKKEIAVKAQEQGNTAYEEAMNLIDPNKEIKQAKAPVPKVVIEEPILPKAKAPIKKEKVTA